MAIFKALFIAAVVMFFLLFSMELIHSALDIAIKYDQATHEIDGALK